VRECRNVAVSSACTMRKAARLCRYGVLAGGDPDHSPVAGKLGPLGLAVAFPDSGKCGIAAGIAGPAVSALAGCSCRASAWFDPAAAFLTPVPGSPVHHRTADVRAFPAGAALRQLLPVQPGLPPQQPGAALSAGRS